MAFTMALPAMSIDILLPALGYMVDAYQGASSNNISFVIAVFFAGLGLGQLFFGPLCDATGRKKCIYIGLAFFIVGTLICVFAQSLTALLIGRFIQGFGTSGPRIATVAMVRDQYQGNEMARIMSFIIMIFILVPMIAPMLGQLILQTWNWHHIFIFLLIQAIFIGLWLSCRQRETLLPEQRRPLKFRAVAETFVFIVKIPSVVGFTLASAATYGAMVTYVSIAQHLFQNIYETGARFPLYFALVAGAIGLASFINGKFVRRLGMLKLSFFAMWLNVGCASSLVVICIAVDGVPHLHIFTAFLMIGFFGNGMLTANLSSLTMQPLGHVAGFGTALVSSTSTLLAIPFALITNHFIGNNITPFALCYLFAACSATLFAYWASKHPVPTEDAKNSHSGE